MKRKSRKTFTNLLLIFTLILSMIAPINASVKAADYITVAEAIANNSGKAAVRGYIVGYTNSGPSYTKDPAGFKDDTNFAIADSPEEADPAKIMPVQITNSFRAEFGLKTNPENIGKKVEVAGNLEKYFGAPGLKSPTAMSFTAEEGEEPAPDEPVTLTTIPETRTKALGSTVLTAGTVTAVFPGTNTTVYIQDDAAGIVLYGPGINAEVGDRVEAKGKLTDYQSLLEIEVKSEDVQVKGKGEAPKAALVTAADLKEANEARLLTLKKVTVESVSSGTFTAKDENGETLTIRPGDASLLKTGVTYDSITGVLGSYKDVYQLIPRNSLDVVEDATKVQAVAALPGAGFIKAGGTVELATATEGAAIHYTIDGSTPSEASKKYTGPITIEEDTVIKAIAYKDGLTPSTVSVFEYKIQEGAIRIHDIQGAGHTSPFKDQAVAEIEGIVTYVVDNNNFYMQDNKPDKDDSTSEGILVYKKAHDRKTGDLVKVDGTVKEFVLDGYSDKGTTDLPVTEINASNIVTVKSGEPLPAAIVIGKDRKPPTEKIDSDNFGQFNPETDGIDFYESLEGMLVQLDSPKVVAPQQYGEVVVVPADYETNTKAGGVKMTESDTNPERIHLKINDEAYVTKTGDSFDGSITGVVSYGYSNFKVLTDKNELPKLVDGGTKREVTSIKEAEDKLTIASYNVENFSPKTSDDKLVKLAEGIVTNLNSPDIVGLTEMQDNDGEADSGTVDASQSFEKLIAKVKELGGPDYLYTDIAPEDKKDGGAPGGNIRVGFLYKKDRIKMTEGTKGTALQPVGFEDGKLTLNPGRIDPANEAFASSRKPLAAQFEFKGDSVIVVANHFNSKGGDQPLFGKNQPPVLNSEVQRLKIAGIVNGFVKNVKEKDPKANVVLLGDFNDFEFSKPLAVLKGNEMTNMVDKVPFEQRYSYTYQGNSQVLDHILVSNNIAGKTKAEIVHINSSFTEADGRASDHDPLLIQTELKQYKKVMNLKGFKTKKLTIQTDNTLVNVDSSSSISEGIWLKASGTAVNGGGLAKTKVVISPAKAGASIDLSGADIQEAVIDNANVTEIYGAENVKKWTVTDGVDVSGIKFYNSKGEAIASPFVPEGNRIPVLVKEIPALQLAKGETALIDLSGHFSDPDGDELSYSATIGTIEGTKLHLAGLEEGSYLAAVTASYKWDQTVTARFSITVKPKDGTGSYYKNAEGKSGQALKKSLHEIIKGHTQLTYSQVWDALKKTDEDPLQSNNVRLLYSGRSISKGSNGGNAGQWNREHVWAKSHGDFGTAKGPGTDIHHLRPEEVTVNSKRGHLDFDEGGSAYSGCDCKVDGDSFEPPDNVKGDIARMLFYMAVRYDGNGEIDLELSDTVNTYPKALHGKLSALLKWNREDPVDDFERKRNETIYKDYQHNRNPFIDHPEWAELIWDQSGVLPKAS